MADIRRSGFGVWNLIDSLYLGGNHPEKTGLEEDNMETALAGTRFVYQKNICKFHFDVSPTDLYADVVLFVHLEK